MQIKKILKLWHNAKITEVEGKMPNITSLAIASPLNAFK